MSPTELERIAWHDRDKNYLALARSIIYNITSKDALISVGVGIWEATEDKIVWSSRIYSLEQAKQWKQDYKELGSWKLVEEKHHVSMFKIANVVSRLNKYESKGGI